ncbi:probable poly(ADP-ribose) glycohydrolase 2 [Phtheirospermum japonicum]|uniref:poly(ADP-ribose) glycohydrolase n=1 Tax=Phtheirospermum japonicum TaxID=374723 RepID=A0A830CZH6_9LAMI|nr:probable poly(ADP-ribose) glycohydrolase 2 [Phtheirospermum japonicum]
MNKDESKKWFGEVVPRLADLVLRLPALLEAHYKNAGETGLRLLKRQQPGIVVLSQELIAALLVCSLFCLFPTTNRGDKHLRPINFDGLSGCLYVCYEPDLENKIKCIVHYFERVSTNMPTGNVSFERKVLPLNNNNPSNTVYPNADFWSKSTNSLCRFEVHTSGAIEDQTNNALEVDFADMYIGGLVLQRGTLQEEIRFSINPELIVSILFLPVMDKNESIEMVGAERFSNYTGYDRSFRFSGDHTDNKGVDAMGRRQTRVIAIDALDGPGMRQYGLESLLREANKAYCGFLLLDPNVEGGETGVATGNWGCGVFGGDVEVKVVIQWLAASEARRPFVSYYTFGVEALAKLGPFVQWVESRKWSVGEVWSRLVAYSGERLRGETTNGFFEWLVPALFPDRSKWNRVAY